MVQASYVPDCVHLVGSIGLNGARRCSSTVRPASAHACNGSPTASQARAGSG